MFRLIIFCVERNYLLKSILTALLVLTVFPGLRAEDGSAVLSDKTFVPYIKTVQLYVDPIILSDPVIPLRGASQLHLEFDDLEGDKKNYYYTIIHCNFDWTPSDLSSFDYIDGFREQDLNDFSFSFNTKQAYTHYNLLFPNENMKPSKSGNYILKVYLDNDPGHVVLTRRFIVVENKVQINSQVHSPVDNRYTNTYQEVDFIVNYNGISISNPINDVRVLVMQNFRWDNAITDLQPVFMKPGELEYTYDLKNAFPAGKEFRYFDTRSIRYHTERVNDIVSDAVKTDVFLTPDISRSDQQYLYHKDIDGKFIPGIVEGFNQQVEPDYTWVNFNLPFDYPLGGTSLFLLGKFTDWELKDEFQLRYNPDHHNYTARVFLKQGYYEYEMVTAEKDATTSDHDLLEGDSYETENQYQVFVYLRPFGSRYDEVIAYKATDSFNHNR